MGGSWIYKDDVVKLKLAKCPFIGFLVDEDDERIVLTMASNNETGWMLNQCAIPKACIKKMVEVKW